MSGRESAAAPETFASLEQGIVDHLFELQPGLAVFLGLHEYDGRLPEYSRSATERWASKADGLISRLRAVPSSELPGRPRDRPPYWSSSSRVRCSICEIRRPRAKPDGLPREYLHDGVPGPELRPPGEFGATAIVDTLRGVPESPRGGPSTPGASIALAVPQTGRVDRGLAGSFRGGRRVHAPPRSRERQARSPTPARQAVS